MPITSGSFEEQPRWSGGDPDIEFRSPDATSRIDDEDVVVAECAPPDYPEGREPHNGRLDRAEGE